MYQMNTVDEDLYGTLVKVENKDIFIDLKKNRNGLFLKISERNGTSRNTVIIPASGISRVRKALEALDDILETNVGTVNSSNNGRARSSIESNAISRSIYVTGLPWETKDDELSSFFSIVGQVVSASVLHQRRGGRDRSLGCGVVEFTAEEDARKAITELNETMFKDRIIRIREDRSSVLSTTSSDESPKSMTSSVSIDSRGSSRELLSGMSSNPVNPNIPDSYKVFVSTLNQKLSIETVTNICSSVGEVISINRVTLKSKRTAGWVVVYSAEKSTFMAVESLNLRDMDGYPLAVRHYINNISGGTMTMQT